MSTQTTPLVAQVVHRLPGRLRIRLAQLRSDPAYVKDLKHMLGSVVGVTEVRVNPLASSMIITYQVQHLTEQELFQRLGITAPHPAVSPTTALEPSALAQRLAVSPQTLALRCVESDFLHWSHTQDPEDIGWLYNPTANAFYPVASPPASVAPPTLVQKQAHRKHLKEEIGEALGADFGETIGEVVGEGIGALLGVEGAWLGGDIGGTIGEEIGEKLGEAAAHEGEASDEHASEAVEVDLDKEVEAMTVKIAGLGTGELIGEVVGEAVGGLLMGPLGMAIGAELGAVLGGEVGEAVSEDVERSLEAESTDEQQPDPPHTPPKKSSRKKK